MSDDGSEEIDQRSRQKRVGDALRRDTRQRLLEAAETEFATSGYAGTTVTRLAAAAGVSVQTVYLAWGSKRELLRGYMEEALAGGSGSPEDAAARFAVTMHPRERLTELAHLVAEIAQRAALGWSLYRDAAAVDQEIAADWSELQLLRHQLFDRILSSLPRTELRQGLTPAAAIDTAWAIASPESYDLLVNRLHYSLDGFREWMEHTMTAALLEPEVAGPSA